MSPTTVAIIGLGVMLLLMFLRLPVGFAMGLAGFLGLMYYISPRAALHILGTDIWGQFSSYGLTAIPLFILMGYICFNSQISVRLFDTAYKWVGQIRGGLAMATVVACAGFAAICGSNSATAATMGTVSLPQMKKYGYQPVLSTSTVASGSILGVVIPPSVVLIIIGLQTGQSVIRLFFGGIFPGLLLSLLFLITIYAICRWKPDFGPAGARTSLKEKIVALPGALEVLVLFALVLGGLYLGWFTPTEAGAAGAFGAIVVALVRRELNWKRFTAAIQETLRTSCMVVVLVTGAVIFGRFVAATRLPFVLADWAVALPVPPASILAIVLLIYILGGCLMDALGFLVITIPIFFPLLIALGYDPVWSGVILTIATTIGAITPPVGINVYVVKGLVPDVPLETIFRGVGFYFIACIVCLILLVVFPQITLFLPRVIG
ncbi:MAG: TRAP transporter large permease [Dehalococcoidia bacterium]